MVCQGEEKPWRSRQRLSKTARNRIVSVTVSYIALVQCAKVQLFYLWLEKEEPKVGTVHYIFCMSLWMHDALAFSV